MMEPGIITDENEIKKFIECDDKEDIWGECFEGWKLNLRLGSEVYLSSEDLPKKLKKGDLISIRSGEFALLITEEKIKLPLDVMGFISMRFSFKRKGLINVSGFHVDPGYEGKLIFSVYNAGPNDIVVRRCDSLFMIFFERLDEYIDEKFKQRRGYENIPADMVSDIKGRSVTLSNNAAKIEKLEFYFKVLLGVVIALASLVVAK
ncbi:MAG: dCTP deaminase [Thermoanaerobacter sp.]|nr:dCTP deaminase [Thermoanaerobacter sp.]